MCLMSLSSCKLQSQFRLSAEAACLSVSVDILMFANKITYWLRYLFRPPSSPKVQDVGRSWNETLGVNTDSVALCVALRSARSGTCAICCERGRTRMWPHASSAC